MLKVYYKVNGHGYRRGPYRQTPQQAQGDRPRDGTVVEAPADEMLSERRIDWDAVDSIFAADGVDGITLVYRRALKDNRWNLVVRATIALERRWRDVPDPHS